MFALLLGILLLQKCISYGFHLVNVCASSCQSAVLTTLCVAAATRNVLLSASPDLSVADSCQHNFWRNFKLRVCRFQCT